MLSRRSLVVAVAVALIESGGIDAGGYCHGLARGLPAQSRTTKACKRWDVCYVCITYFHPPRRRLQVSLLRFP